MFVIELKFSLPLSLTASIRVIIPSISLSSPFLSTETAVQAVEAGVGAVSIMDGRVRHCILKALSGEVFGTSIVKG